MSRYLGLGKCLGAIMRDLTIGLLGALLGGFVIFLSRLPIAQITTLILNNPAAAVAALAALFAFIAGVLGPFVQWRVGRRSALASQTSAEAAMLAARTAGFREIAKLRMSWMDALRNTLAEYHSILMNLEDKEALALSSDRGRTEGPNQGEQWSVGETRPARYTSRSALEQG